MTGNSSQHVLIYGAWAGLPYYITAYEQTQLNRVCYFRFFDVFLASRVSVFRTCFLFTVAGVLPFGGRKTSPRALSQCTLYFLVLWDHLAHTESV